MIKKYLIALSLSLMLAPSAFADEVLEEDVITEEDVTSVVEETTVSADSSMLCGCGGGWDNWIYINVGTTVSAEVDKVSVYGSFYVENAESKIDAIDQLNAVYKDMQSTLSKYGTVSRTGIYAYSDWEYTSMYDGSVSIKLTLNNNAQVESIENLFYENGFDAWREVTVVDAIAAEKEAVPTLKDLIADKKDVYEQLLGSKLGSLSSLNIYSWSDSTTFNPETNMVDVMVYADLNYNLAE